MKIASRWRWVLALILPLLATSAALAQKGEKNPDISYVFPGGGCRGTSFDVIVGGQYIKEVTKAFISGEGIETKIVEWYRPMTQGEYVKLNRDIRTKQEEDGISREAAIKALGITDEQLEEMKIYQERRNDPKRQPNPQLDEMLTVRIKVADDAEIGGRELRLLTETGMSNPLWFYVGQWPDVREQEPNNVKPHDDVVVQMPSVINGQIMPGDVDRFAFQAKKGTKLVAQCAARELIPYLADAVPGWFQAVLRLYDEQGREVAFADSLGFRQDPVLYYEVPKDGTYVVEVRDSIYRGREDFVYRIAIGEIPYVTSLFPLGGKVGETCTVELHGWNLPVETLRVDAASYRGRSVQPVVLEHENIVSNKVGFMTDVLTEVMENEPNDTAEKARRVGKSVVINGRIDKPGDVDYYEIDAAGAMVAEVYARRLYSPLDSVVRLQTASGKVVAHSDDYEDKSWPLITHHADSRLLANAAGASFVTISDAQGRGGPEYAYRLCIRPPRPDFNLYVTPSSVIAQAGTCVPITVHAVRRDGFDGDITLALENAPPGFELSGGWVPGDEDSCRLTLTVPKQPLADPIVMNLVGHASVRGRKISRLASPAEDVMQAFIYHHLVPTKDWTILVTGEPPGDPPCTFVGRTVRLNADGVTPFPVKAAPHVASELRFQLSLPPKGITLEDPVLVPQGVVVPIKCDKEKIEAGLKGNLLFILSREREVPPKEKGDKPTTYTSRIGFYPAIPFEVVSSRRR